jgi:hypothetical protein
MTNNKQSSVEWLEIQLKKGIPFNRLDPLSFPKAVDNLFEQAKAMHKEEIINIVVWCDDTNRRPQQIKIEAEQYYNETYGGNK